MARVQRWRVWLALLAVPVILAGVFAPFAIYFALARGLRGQDIAKAIEPISFLPVSIGFAASLLLTQRLAKSDGLTLRDLGWARPAPADVAAGLGAGAILWALNARLLYPLVQRAQPAFVREVKVSRDGDRLVLDPVAPERFSDAFWEVLSTMPDHCRPRQRSSARAR